MTHPYEIEELACRVLGLAEDTDSEVLEQEIYNKFSIDLWQFGEVVKALLPFTPVIETAVTNTRKHAFIDRGYIICSTDDI